MELVKIESTAGSENNETQLLRAELLSNIPFFHRLLLNIPGTHSCSFIQQSAAEITPEC
jgi:hypothetical protein